MIILFLIASAFVLIDERPSDNLIAESQKTDIIIPTGNGMNIKMTIPDAPTFKSHSARNRRNTSTDRSVVNEILRGLEPISSAHGIADDDPNGINDIIFYLRQDQGLAPLNADYQPEKTLQELLDDLENPSDDSEYVDWIQDMSSMIRKQLAAIVYAQGSNSNDSEFTSTNNDGGEMQIQPQTSGFVDSDDISESDEQRRKSKQQKSIRRNMKIIKRAQQKIKRILAKSRKANSVHRHQRHGRFLSEEKRVTV